jgi:hypothetical protein
MCGGEHLKKQLPETGRKKLGLAQPPQAIIDIKKFRLSPHRIISYPLIAIESETASRGVQLASRGLSAKAGTAASVSTTALIFVRLHGANNMGAPLNLPTLEPWYHRLRYNVVAV